MPLRDYKEDLYAELKDREYACGYLNACYEESLETFLIGLLDVVNANGGVAAVAGKGCIEQAVISNVILGDVDPDLFELKTVLNAVGIKIKFVPKTEEADAKV